MTWEQQRAIQRLEKENAKAAKNASKEEAKAARDEERQRQAAERQAAWEAAAPEREAEAARKALLKQERDVAKAEHKQAVREARAAVRMRFEGIVVTNTEVSADGQTGPLAGAVARIETSGEISSRITATRMVMLGVFAIAARKKKDKRTLYLTIEGQGVAALRELSVKDEKDARKFVAQFNALASAATAADAAAAPPPLPQTAVVIQAPAAIPVGEVASPAEQVRQLAALRDEGLMTDEEFDQKRREILGL